MTDGVLGMDLNSIGLLKAITERMEWLGERERVLAENIANADTPGYKPKDLKQVSFGDLLKGPNGTQLGITARVTQPGHLGGFSRGDGGKWRVTRSKTYETAPDGNGVNLEQQMMNVAETQADHNLMTSLYRKQIGMLRKALGRGQGG